MAQTVRATFDGAVLRPEQPVGLQANTTYLVTIEREAPVADASGPDVYPLTAIGRLATDMGVTALSVHHTRYAHDGPVDEDGGA
jgi:hypothetical protein